MRLKRFLGLVLAVALFVSLSSMGTASAQDISHSKSYLVVKATGRFSMEVPGNTAVQAGSSFPLEVGDVVVIMTTYSPFSASVDFGLIAPDGLFYGSNTWSYTPLGRIEGLSGEQLEELLSGQSALLSFSLCPQQAS